MTISKSLKFATLHNMAIFTRDNAGKGYTIAALVEDYNDTAMMMGFDFLMIGKPGRVAKLVELMDHVLRRLEAMPEYAQPAPEITAEQRADHLQTAEALTGILKAHDIDPQDWDAVMDYLFSTQGHPLKYMVKIYVDYIHGTASDLGYTLANPEHVAHEGWDCPAMVQDEYEGWQEIRTEQEARAVLTRACNNWVSQSNRLPRGNCALRMLSLGWTFNH